MTLYNAITLRHSRPDLPKLKHAVALAIERVVNDLIEYNAGGVLPRSLEIVQRDPCFPPGTKVVAEDIFVAATPLGLALPISG